MIATKGSVRLIADGRNISLCIGERDIVVPSSEVANVIDCLLTIDGRKGPVMWVADQIGVTIDHESILPEHIDARPPARYEGRLVRCPRGEPCGHEKLCPGSIR